MKRQHLVAALALLLAGTAAAAPREVRQSISLIPRYNLTATTDPNPIVKLARATTYLGRLEIDGVCRCGVDSVTVPHSWMHLVWAVQRRAIDYAHPHYAPVVVDSSRDVAPGDTVTVKLAHQQPGDVYLFRWVNLRGPACWSWMPLEAWVP